MDRQNIFIMPKRSETSRWVWLVAKCGHRPPPFLRLGTPPGLPYHARVPVRRLWKRRERPRYEPPMDKLFCGASLTFDWIVCLWWGIERTVEALWQYVCVCRFILWENLNSLRIFTTYGPTPPVDVDDWSGQFALSRVTGRSGTCAVSSALIGFIKVLCVNFYLRRRWMMSCTGSG